MENQVITTGVQAFQVVEIIFYGVIWWVAALSGMARAAFDNDYRSWRHLCSIGIMSGFVGISVVGLGYKWLGGSGGDEFYFIALATMAGLMGKEQTVLLTFLFRKALKTLLGEELYNELAKTRVKDVE